VTLLFDLGSINWAEVLINTIIAAALGIGISLFFRYFIIEDINRIYKRNRTQMIHGLLSEVYRIQRIIGEVFTILERQPDFYPAHGCLLHSLTDSDKRVLQAYYNQVHNAFERMKGFNDWTMHMTDVEILAITNYANYSDQFLEFLNHDFPEYFPEMLNWRKQSALEMIGLLGDFVTEEFRNAWREVS